MSSLNMSLFYVLTHSFTLWPEAYECSNKSEYSGTKWPFFGIYLIVSGSIFLALYIPCFISIVRVKTHTPAYQLMLTIGFLDILSLIFSCLIPGFILYNGFTFCQYPLCFHINGSLCNFAWMTDCLCCIFLAIERCVEINPKFFLYFLFGKRVFRCVMIVIFAYGFFSLFFTIPLIFNLEHSCYLSDPMIGKDPLLYRNLPHAANNLMVAISTTTLYFYLCYYLLCKFGYSTSMWLYKSKKQIILQGVILCFFHAAAGLIYEYIQNFYSPQWLILVAHIVWQCSCGCLSVVYLTLNRTIRNSVLKMMIPWRIRKRLGLYIGVEEHQALEHPVEASARGGAIAMVNGGGNAVKIDNFFPG